MTRRNALIVLAACYALLFATGQVFAQSVDSVLLVVNDASQDSIRVGDYYAQKRSLAKDHVVHVKTWTSESIERPEYERTIEGSIAAALSQRKLQDRILYIVLTKGIPLRVAGTQGTDGLVASVDSELTQLYRKMLGIGIPLVGRLPNPYFLGESLLASAKPFVRGNSDLYLVTRLDGFTVEDVVKLIDRAAAPSREGKIVLDQKATLMDAGGDKWLSEAAERLRLVNGNDRVVLEDTKATVTAAGPVLGYYSWGSNDPSNRLRQFGLQFVNGAIGAMFVSTDGRTFTEPPATWKPGETGVRAGNSGTQSLVGDLIRDGITGVAGHVAEPYLDATIRPQILFPAYLQGFNLAESFYLAMPYLSWQTVVVGDPLCAPFARGAATSTQLQTDIDPDTEQPALFSQRKLAVASKGGLKIDALKLVMKAEARAAQGDAAAVEPLFVRATDLEPRLAAIQLQLASIYEASGQFDKAIDRYRRGLSVEPKNPLFLNNLAYGLAVHKNAAAEALPLAEQAYELAKTPAVADTLGWVRHLLGDDRGAAPLLERAVAAAPVNADVLLHAAIVHEALGDKPKAASEMDAAVKLNPAIASREDAKALRSRIGAGR
jgi:uncharacterized protein (TIGR03790 family)